MEICMRWFMLCSHLIKLKTFYPLVAHCVWNPCICWQQSWCHGLTVELVSGFSCEEWDFLSPLTVFKWCCWSKSTNGFAAILQQCGKRKDKDYSCQQEIGRGEQNQTKPGFHNQRSVSVFLQCKAGQKNEMYLGFPNNKYFCSVKNSINNTEITDMPF